MTTMVRSLERQMTVLGYLIERNKALRLRDFEPLLRRIRLGGDNKLFPLSRTTMKSTLATLTKHGLVNAETVRMGNREYRVYEPTKEGRAAFQKWSR